MPAWQRHPEENKDLLMVQSVQHAATWRWWGGGSSVYLFLTVDVFLLAQAHRTPSKINCRWQTSPIRTSRYVFWTNYDTNFRFSFNMGSEVSITTLTWIGLLWLQNPHAGLHPLLCSTFCEGQSGGRLDGPDALSPTLALGSRLSNIPAAVCGDSWWGQMDLLRSPESRC